MCFKLAIEMDFAGITAHLSYQTDREAGAGQQLSGIFDAHADPVGLKGNSEEFRVQMLEVGGADPEVFCDPVRFIAAVRLGLHGQAERLQPAVIGAVAPLAVPVAVGICQIVHQQLHQQRNVFRAETGGAVVALPEDLLKEHGKPGRIRQWDRSAKREQQLAPDRIAVAGKVDPVVDVVPADALVAVGKIRRNDDGAVGIDGQLLLADGEGCFCFYNQQKIFAESFWPEHDIGLRMAGIASPDRYLKHGSSFLIAENVSN